MKASASKKKSMPAKPSTAPGGPTAKPPKPAKGLNPKTPSGAKLSTYGKKAPVKKK